MGDVENVNYWIARWKMAKANEAILTRALDAIHSVAKAEGLEHISAIIEKVMSTHG